MNRSLLTRRTSWFALPVLAAILLAPTVTHAHHILGIPHYAYDERYPQVPILTYRVDAGPYEVEMTGYPGTPEPGEQCFLNVYIREPDDGVPFDGVVTLEVMRDRMIGGDPTIYGPVEARLEESVYKFYPRFDVESNYTIRIRYQAEGAPWIIDLPMVIGEPGSPWLVLGGIAAGVLAFLVAVRAARIKLQRRARRVDPAPGRDLAGKRASPPASTGTVIRGATS